MARHDHPLTSLSRCFHGSSSFPVRHCSDENTAHCGDLPLLERLMVRGLKGPNIVCLGAPLEKPTFLCSYGHLSFLSPTPLIMYCASLILAALFRTPADVTELP